MTEARTTTIEVEGHQLVVLPLNPDATGIPVVMLHGITASLSFWMGISAEPFLPVGPCYALTLPGHYPAVFPKTLVREDLTAEMIARVLTQAIRELLGDEPVLLVGHSTGGFAVLDIAAYMPEIARGVVSINGFAQGVWTGLLGFYQRIARLGRPGQVGFKAAYTSAQVSRALFKTLARFYVAEPRAIYAKSTLDITLEPVWDDFRRLNLDAMCDYFAVMPDIDITPQLSKITAPVLALTGAQDPIVPPIQTEVIADGASNAEAVMIDRAGHMPFYEQPASYGQAIVTWLERQVLDEARASSL
jgi:pimeloyl-ACP methyl ester carboxylesterase